MTKYIQKGIRDLFEYALYEFTLYLLTHLLTCPGKCLYQFWFSTISCFCCYGL